VIYGVELKIVKPIGMIVKKLMKLKNNGMNLKINGIKNIK